MYAAIVARDHRILAHCREGLALVRRVPAYRGVVLARLAPALTIPPDDLWSAAPWIWAVALGGASPSSGMLAADVVHVGSAFARALTEDTSPEGIHRLFTDLCNGRCDAGVVMRSHPFPDLRAWSLRTTLGV